jgi:hypothetical protein
MSFLAFGVLMPLSALWARHAKTPPPPPSTSSSNGVVRLLRQLSGRNWLRVHTGLNAGAVLCGLCSLTSIEYHKVAGAHHHLGSTHGVVGAVGLTVLLLVQPINGLRRPAKNNQPGRRVWYMSHAFLGYGSISSGLVALALGAVKEGVAPAVSGALWAWLIVLGVAAVALEVRGQWWPCNGGRSLASLDTARAHGGQHLEVSSLSNESTVHA